MLKNKNNKAIWGSRIKKDASTLFQKVGNSIDIDKKLFEEATEIKSKKGTKRSARKSKKP